MIDFLKEKSIDTFAGKIFYWLDNSFPGRPTAFFLHGLSSNHTTWLNATGVLHEHKYNSLVWDMRGHGLSDKTKKRGLYKLPVFSEDLEKIINREQIEKPVLVGYSFGGSIAIEYAVKHAESLGGLILISANHADPMEYKGLGFLTMWGLGAANLLAFLMLWQSRQEYHYYRHGKVVGYWDSVWDGIRTMPISVNLWLFTQIVAFNFKNTIHKIKAPITIISAKKDPFVTAAEISDLKKELSHAKFIFSKTDSHFVGTNSQDEVAQIILDFLKNKSR